MSPDLKAPINHIPFYHRRWFKRSLFALVTLLFFAVVAGIVIFIMWWNSPERALLDAADYLIKTPGSYHVVSKDTDLTVTVRDQTYAARGTLKGIAVDLIYSGSTLDVKSPEPDKLYAFFMGTSTAAIPSVVQAIVPTVRDKWISINLASMTLKSPDATKLQCVFQERDTIAHDANARRQWGSVYLSNRFLDVTTSKQGDATRYQLSIDKKNRANFFSQLLKTSFYQSLDSCSADTDVFASAPASGPFVAVTLESSHHIFRSAVIDPTSKTPTTITATYTNVPAIVAPPDAIGSDQLVIRYLQSFGLSQ